MSYGENKNIKSVPEMAFFCKYVRRHFKPELDPKSKAAKKLQQFYISARPLNAGKGAKITVRSLGDLVRLSEASARAHMRNEVTEKDADIAIKILQASIASSGFNALTGEYDPQALEQQKQIENAKGGAPVGFFSAKELLENKTAREIMSQDLEKLAQKRQNRFYREVAGKMKKVVYVIKRYSLQKCRDCGGQGYHQEGNMRAVCYTCRGAGGFKDPFQMSELDYQLKNAGLTTIDIQELLAHLIKRKIIHPMYNNNNSYELTKDYKNALLELQAIQSQIEVMNEVEPEQNKSPVKDPDFQQRINKIKNMLPSSVRDNIRRKLDEVEEE